MAVFATRRLRRGRMLLLVLRALLRCGCRPRLRLGLRPRLLVMRLRLRLRARLLDVRLWLGLRAWLLVVRLRAWLLVARLRLRLWAWLLVVRLRLGHGGMRLFDPRLWLRPCLFGARLLARLLDTRLCLRLPLRLARLLHMRLHLGLLGMGLRLHPLLVHRQALLGNGRVRLRPSRCGMSPGLRAAFCRIVHRWRARHAVVWLHALLGSRCTWLLGACTWLLGA